MAICAVTINEINKYISKSNNFNEIVIPMMMI